MTQAGDAQAWDTQDGEALPGEIPVLPLPRVILLPRVQLPLNVAEPRYLALTRAALAGARLVGVVQPRGAGLAPTGCAGRIVSFSETDDGRYLVTLKGVSRFGVARELDADPAGFRRARPDWAPYAADLREETSQAVCRESLMLALRAYFDKMRMFCDRWETMNSISCESLVSTLSVVCPFAAAEKQALLEAKTLCDRARLLQALLERACVDAQGDPPLCH